MERNERIEPFCWLEYDGGASVTLEAGEFLQEIFETRADEGFEGNGYDWESFVPIVKTQVL